MKTNSKLYLLAFLFCLFVKAISSNGPKSFYDAPTAKAEKIKEKFNSGEFSMGSFAFTENKGQVYGYDGLPKPEVKFVFASGNTQIFLLEKGIAYQFTKMQYPKGMEEYKNSLTGTSLNQKQAVDREKLSALQSQIRTETFRMDMTLVGANKEIEITTEERSADYTNFYNRNVLDVHSYKKVIYHNVYPGIDWVIYTIGKEVKYDFVVKPGADPSLIKMQFDHQEDLQLNEDGSFTLSNLMGKITEKAPVSFQRSKLITTSFKLDANSMSFAVDQYNKDEELIIDPSLFWATYYGGQGLESANDVCTDAFGNVYMTGCTAGSSLNIASSGHQNVSNGNAEAFLVKFNSNGVRQWGTYYGGDAADGGGGCVVDAAGNVYMSGGTQSTVNIASGGHQNSHGGGLSDAFLVKFNSSGVRQWATYYGGSGSEFEEFLSAFTGWFYVKCATDASNNVYICGKSNSTSGIASSGHQNTYAGSDDAFLVKFNSNGVRQWGTYYGGTNIETGNNCKTDLTGNVYLVGFTKSNNGIALSGHKNTISVDSSDAYLVKFNANGVRQWATYYGDSNTDEGFSCATDALGNVYLTGSTSSTVNIVSGGQQSSIGGGTDAFLAKFNTNGVRQWATYCGGNNVDVGRSCSISSSNDVFICGYTNSTINIASGGYQNTYNDSIDAFIVKYNTSGVRQWGSYYGGASLDIGMSLAIDASGNVFLAGITQSSTGIASSGHQNVIGGGYDPDFFWEEAFLVKFCDGASLQAISGNSAICAGSIQTYSVINNPQVVSYSWVLPSGWLGSSTSNIITTTVGVVGGSISVTTSSVCGIQSSVALAVSINSTAPQPIGSILGNTNICAGSNHVYSVLNDNNVNSYTWTLPGSWIGSSTSNSILVTPTSNGNLTLTASNACGSTSLQSNFIFVNPIPTVTANSGSICSGQNFTINASGANSYTYSGGSATVSPLSNTSFSVTGTSSAGCISATPALSSVTVVNSPTVSVNSGTICQGSSFTIMPTGANSYTIEGGNAVVSPLSNSSYTVIGTSAQGCVSQTFATSSVTVNLNPTVTVNSGSICQGSSFTISPSGANTYTIQGGNAVVSPLSNLSFTVRGTSSQGCLSQNTATANVTVNLSPTVAVNSGSICQGNSFTISPSGANTYTIQGGNTVVSPLSNSSYTVRGTSTQGCLSQNTATSSVTVNLNPTVTVNSGSICQGNSFTINPSGANTYTIQGGNTVVSPLSNLSYTVRGTSTQGCLSQNTATSSVTVNLNPTVTVNSGSICQGNSFTINPTGANSYTIQGGNPVVSPNGSASYTVIGTSAQGCLSQNVATSNVTVNINPIISVNSGSICQGNSFTIVPTGANSYTIQGGSNVVSPNTNTNYTVSGTSTEGCTSQNIATASVTVNANPTVTANSGAICTGQSFTIVPSGAFTYSNAGYGTSMVVSPTSNSTFTISGTSAEGCVSIVPAILTVTVNPLPVITVSNGTVCSGQNHTITPTGASTYTYIGGTAVVSPSVNTTYTVVGTSNFGCVNFAIVFVSVNPSPTISISGTLEAICAGESINLTATGASNYTWSEGTTASGITASPQLTTTYSVIGTDANGCESAAAVTQNVDACVGIIKSSNSSLHLVVYPNPSTGTFFIESSQLIELTIYNAIGQFILRQQVNEGKTLININEQSKGIYFIHINQNGKTLTHKLVKE